MHEETGFDPADHGGIGLVDLEVELLDQNRADREFPGAGFRKPYLLAGAVVAADVRDCDPALLERPICPKRSVEIVRDEPGDGGESGKILKSRDFREKCGCLWRPALPGRRRRQRTIKIGTNRDRPRPTVGIGACDGREP